MVLVCVGQDHYTTLFSPFHPPSRTTTPDIRSWSYRPRFLGDMTSEHLSRIILISFELWPLPSSLPGWVSITLPVIHSRRGWFCSIRSTRSPTCKLRCLFLHFCLVNGDCKHCFFQVSQKRSVMYWTYVYLFLGPASSKWGRGGT